MASDNVEPFFIYVFPLSTSAQEQRVWLTPCSIRFQSEQCSEH